MNLGSTPETLIYVRDQSIGNSKNKVAFLPDIVAGTVERDQTLFLFSPAKRFLNN